MKEIITQIDFPDKHFSGIERERLVDSLTDIARNGFGTQMQREDVENHVLKPELLYLIHLDSELVGFCSYSRPSIENKKILYLEGMVVKKDFQKKGFFYKVHEKAFALDNFDFIAMRTQNPVMYAATEKVVHKLYPNCVELPEDVKRLAFKLVIDELNMKVYDRESLIGRGTYGTCLYDFIPRHNNKQVNDLFDKKLCLDYAAGDTVLLFGRLKK